MRFWEVVQLKRPDCAFVLGGHSGTQAAPQVQRCWPTGRSHCANTNGFNESLPESLGANHRKSVQTLLPSLNSAQSGCIVEGEAERSPLVRDFLGFLIFSGASVF